MKKTGAISDYKNLNAASSYTLDLVRNLQNISSHRSCPGYVIVRMQGEQYEYSYRLWGVHVQGVQGLKRTGGHQILQSHSHWRQKRDCPSVAEDRV